MVTSSLNQVIDLIQEDISGSATRRKYQTFVTGGLGPGVTSSLYQTVYDQDFTLQTSNPVMDMTVGLFHFDDGTNTRPNLVTKGTGYSRSTTTGQLNFHARSTMMMREKVNIYRQYAAYLLGDPDDAVQDPRIAGLLQVLPTSHNLILHNEPARHLAPDVLDVLPIPSASEIVTAEHHFHVRGRLVVEARIVLGL